MNKIWVVIGGILRFQYLNLVLHGGRVVLLVLLRWIVNVSYCLIVSRQKILIETRNIERIVSDYKAITALPLYLHYLVPSRLDITS